jgi:signal transduction histidine kinase
MTDRHHDLEQRCAQALREHAVAGDEETLHRAYEFGRLALGEGVGVMEMALMVRRAALAAGRAQLDGEVVRERVDSFVLEAFSPFEMAYRGAREANAALRRLDEDRERQVRRIAHELHDQAGQLLAIVHRALDRLRDHVAPGGGVHLDQAVALLHQVEDEIRRVAHELRPVILDDLGLVPALRFLGQGVAQRSGLAVRVMGSTDGRLAPAVETALYRAAQEALSNVARHARASSATIEVRRAEREVVCRIRDDGWGFDPEAASTRGQREGFGLDGIRERIAPLGGALDVCSRPGHGTEILVRVPLEVAHADSPAHRG